MRVDSAKKALEAVDFKVARANIQDVLSEPSPRQTDCLKATHSLGNILVFLNEYKNPSQAIEAGTTIGLLEWPPGKKRISFVIGRWLVVIYSDLPDTGVADNAFNALKNIG